VQTFALLIMPSRFDSLIASATAKFLSAFGRNMTYRPASNQANDRTIKVIVVEDQAYYGQGSVMNFDELVIEISSRNDTEGVVEINDHMPKRDQFLDPEHSNKLWYVAEIIRDGKVNKDGTHILRLKDQPTR